MSFWEKFKEFDKMMSEPAIEIRVEKQMIIPREQVVQSSQVNKLIEENKRLKKQLKLGSVETKHKLIE